MSIKKLVSQTYLDIKKLSKENPNDMDLGSKVRMYIRQQEEMDSDLNELKNDGLDTPLTTWD
jgi:hypothetical protein